MALFYRNNVISLMCTLVRRKRSLVSSQTEMSYYLTILATKRTSMCFCNISDIPKEKPCDENYSSETLQKEKGGLSDNSNVTGAFDLLLTSGVDMASLKKYEKFLAKSPEESYTKAKLLTEIAFRKPISLPLIKLPVHRLRCISLRSKEDSRFLNASFPDRISYLCHHLELNPSELMNLLYKHSTLLAMRFDRLEKKMSVLKDAGISAQDLVKDPWIFNYNEETLPQRIKKAQEAGVPIKPWLLRCSAKSFASILSKFKKTQILLNGKNEVSFLAEKLYCSEDYVKYMMSRNKLLTAVNVPKLQQVIEFLYEKGYTAEEVRIFPRVFCSSVKTLSKRFDKFYSSKGTMPTMSELCFAGKNNNHGSKK